MIAVIPALVVVAALLQTPPANQACSLLTPAQVSSLIGAARTMPVMAAPNGSSCMFQNKDSIITVLMATASSAASADELFSSKKRVVSGTDVTGWGAPAYAASAKTAAIVGVLMKRTLAEVKVLDPAQTAEALGVKLKAVMKEVAGRK